MELDLFSTNPRKSLNMNNLEAKADELFEFVGPFCAVGAIRVITNDDQFKV